MNAAVFAITVKKRFKRFSSFVLASFSLRTSEIVLPTNAPGGYGNHILRFGWFEEKGRFWQVSALFLAPHHRDAACSMNTDWFPGILPDSGLIYYQTNFL